MKLRYTTEAVADLIRIADDIRAHNPAAALRVRTAILDSIRTLILFPRAGRRQAAEGVRKLVARKYPCLVYYTVDEAAGEAVILNIKHPAQRREHEDG
jgi:plasmid stabilization system protein ParE